MAANSKLVVDASVVLAVLLNEPEKSALVSATEGATLLAPGCLRWEIGNAFSAMLKQQRVSLKQARQGLSILSLIPVQEVDVSLEEALELCAQHNIYAYDAYYLQLARRSSTPLLTLDRKMAQVAATENIHVKDL